MRVKMILPALTEAVSPFFRPIKYSLFPPLGLATLAGYLREEDEVRLQDEHVERLDLDDEPDLVVIQVYITSALRAYRLADHYRRKGAHVALGGLHVTSLPEEAAPHADSIFLGPGEDTWPRFLADFRSGRPQPVYRSCVRTLAALPPIRRDLIRRHLYLVPNSIVVSRGCPHACDFCYKEAFFEGGRGFYTQQVDAPLAEIERLPGRHLYFLDDHLFGDVRFAAALFEGMRGMGRVWQAAGTVQSVLKPALLEKAVASGLRSLFVGFETLNPLGLRAQGKVQNLHRDYGETVRRLHGLGVMVNGSFVFGMDEDDASVFDRTVGWAIGEGIETATFHILTPYPGTALFRRMEAAGRILHRDWDLYDTRHVVFEARGMRAEELESGYWRAYREFYRWGSIFRSASTTRSWGGRLRHLAYAGGWKKFEPLWDWVIRARRVSRMLPLLEAVLG
ncbi:MAG TPA: radical SAM protein [Vicinamibacteria bacterium]|nr:radical SAM protein [Vicinamibacteria bacterium]